MGQIENTRENLTGFIDAYRKELTKDAIKRLDFLMSDELAKYLSKISSTNITTETLILSRNALGKVADNFSNLEIVDIIKKNYIASGKKLNGDLFDCTDEMLKVIREELTAITKSVGLPAKGELMSKIMHVSLIRETSQGFIAVPKRYRTVGNYVGRAKDFEPVSVQKLVADYRLDYKRTDYGDYIESYGVIKFKNTEPSKVDFAIGTKGDASPNTRSGMLGNDSRVIFEYKMEPRNLQEGDVLEVYDAKGVLSRQYMFDEKIETGEVGWIIVE